VNLPRGLVVVPAAVFGLTGVAYLVAPGLALSVVGVTSGATSDFLLRTEGVALVSAAILLWAARDGSARQLRVVLIALAVYFILGSVVDLAAFAQGVVGPASVPSAAVRIGVGVLCLAVVWRLPGTAADPRA